jgi:hypothetical protein
MFNLNIIHWNCFKLSDTRLFELEIFISKFKPDIISLQEIKLTNENANYEIRFDGYSTYHRLRSVNPDKGGGVAFLVSDKLNHCSFFDDDDYLSNLEIVGITIEVDSFKLHLFSYYNTPTDLLDYALFMKLNRLSENFLIVGDLNSKTPVVGCQSLNSSGRVLEKILMDTELVVFNNNLNTYHQFGSEYEEILDLIIGSGSLVGNVLDFEVLNDQSLLSSDHFPIKVRISAKGDLNSSTEAGEKLNFVKADWYYYSDLLREKANSYSENFLNSLDVNGLNSIITNDIHLAANISIPKFKKGSRKTFPEPILNLIRKRRQARKELKKNRSDFNKKSYNDISNLVKLNIKSFKEKKWSRLLDGLGEHPVSTRLFWKEINKTKSSKQASSIPTLKVGQVEYKNDMDKISLFSTILSDTFSENLFSSEFDQNFPSIAKNEVDNLDLNNCKVEFFSTLDMYKVLNKLKINSSPGPDGILNILLKKLPFGYIKRILLKLVNLTLIEGIPDSWKIANIIMIPKKTSKSKDPGDYRPISMTSCLGKLCERLMRKRLNKILEQKNILVKQQSGFRNEKRASDNLVFCTQKIGESINRGKRACGIFFDISKAFDKVWHNGLIYKLIKLGIEKYIIKFIINFLSNRTFRIKINEVEGDLFPIKCSVPQGSVLAPILFLIYINDIPLVDSKHINYSSLFADDLAVFFLFQSPKHMEKKINKYLESLVDWLFKWRLKMNPNKCCYTIFSKKGNFLRKGSKIEFKLNLSEGDIPYNPKPLFLGIIFDEFLCFNEHVKMLKARAIKRINILKIIRHKSWGLSQKTLKQVYMALIGSIFAYSFPILANASISNINKLQIIQNKAIRLIFRLDWNSLSSSLSNISNILSVRERLLQLGCRYFNKSMYNNSYVGELIQEYLGSVSKITKNRKRETVLCLFFPYIALGFACRVFVFLLVLSWSL